MTLNPGDFTLVHGGCYFIGIPSQALEKLHPAIHGSSIKKEYLQTSSPRHEININDVCISQRLVTCSDFGDFSIETGYKTEAEADGWGWVWERGWEKRKGANWKNPFGCNRDDMYREGGRYIPVLQITWNDSMEYCRWLSGKSGRNVRLPGEGEWEVFAGMCGAGNIDTLIELDKEMIGEKKIGEDYFFLEVKRFNPFILPGLIWEWTMDWFNAYPGGEPHRDFGLVYKVLRGGSYLSHPVQRISEYRFRRCPTARSPFYGLRIAVEGHEIV